MTKRPSPSKLTPHTDIIFRWKEEGRSYREMAALLMKEYGLDAHPDTIHSFVQVRTVGGSREAGQEAGASVGAVQAAQPTIMESFVVSLLKTQQEHREQLAELKQIVERTSEVSARDRQEDRRVIEALVARTETFGTLGKDVRQMADQVQAAMREMRKMSEDRQVTAADLDRATKLGWVWLGMGAVVLVGMVASWKEVAGIGLAAIILSVMGWWMWMDWRRRTPKTTAS